MKNLDVKFTEKDGLLYIQSPYNQDFIKAVKAKGGKWKPDTKEWAVSIDHIDSINNTLVDCYGVQYLGDEKSEIEKVKVRLRAYDFEDEDTISIDGIVLVSRRGRDLPVSYHNGAIVVEGEFPSSGGSRNNPEPAPDYDVILEAEIPLNFYERHKDDLELVDELKQSKEKLLAEKERLEKRLAEIEEELKSL